jgi:hypothetical protein
LSEIRRTGRRQGVNAGRAVALLAALVPVSSRAQDEAPRAPTSDGAVAPVTASSTSASTEPNPEKSRQTLRRLTEQGAYVDLFATLMFGDGLRFNNPYRLTHVLGETGESLSLTAPYVDLALGVATGSPTGLVHGARIGWSIAVSGVPQSTVTPAYLAAWRPSGHWLVYAWLGVPILTAPDMNAGGELALAGTYFARAGIGATAALVADGFYGAGTRERRAAFYPVLSAQLGVSVNYEVLP